MDTEKKNQLIDAILNDPNRMFNGAIFAPFERNPYFKRETGGRWVSRLHLDDGEPSADGIGAYIDDGRPTNEPLMLFDASGDRHGKIRVFQWWIQEHGENSMSELYKLYDIEPPQRDPEQVKREQKQKTDTDTLLSDIRRDFLGNKGAAVRDYLTRPIEQGGRGWKADTVSAMADKNYIGIVTNDTARRLSELSGLNIPANIADTHPFVIFTFAKSDGRLQYVKFRTIDPQAKGGDKWRNPTKGKTGVGRDNVDPFNYNNVSFLSATGSRTLVVVESELCAAHATVAGIKNVIALRGSDGIKPQFAQQIARTGCTKIVFLYDTEGDDKKQNETDKKLLKAIKGLREQVEHITTYVATIPDELNAKDPDELLSRHPDDGAAILQGIIDNASTSTQWMAKRYADRYQTATTDEEQKHIVYDVVNQAAELKDINSMVAIDGVQLIREFCRQSGTDIDAETMAQAANEKAMQTAQVEFDKNRDKLLTEYDDARKQGDNKKAADIIKRLGQLTEPQNDPESNWTSKTYDDYAAELWRDESKDLTTSYQINIRRKGKNYEKQNIVLPANGITYIAGGTGHGKSTLLQNIAYDLMTGRVNGYDPTTNRQTYEHAPKRVLYYGFEEEKRSTIFEFINIHVHARQRLQNVSDLSQRGSNYGINAYLHTGDKKVFDGDKYKDDTENDPTAYPLTDEDKGIIGDAIRGFFKMYKGAEHGEDCKLFLYDDNFTSTELVEHIKKVFPIHHPDVIFIDYMQFLEKEATTQQFEDLGRVSKDLIAINKMFNVPIVAAAQLKEKNNVKSSPDELDYTDIFGASSIAQGAAAVYVIGKSSRYKRRDENGIIHDYQSKVKYCGEEYILGEERPQMWVKCVKNRFGADGGQAIYTFNGAKRYINPESLVSANNTDKPKENNNRMIVR